MCHVSAFVIVAVESCGSALSNKKRWRIKEKEERVDRTIVSLWKLSSEVLSSAFEKIGACTGLVGLVTPPRAGPWMLSVDSVQWRADFSCEKQCMTTADFDTTHATT